MLMKIIEIYLASRRAGGFKLRGEENQLRRFAEFAATRGDRHVRRETVLAWAARAPSPHRRERWLRTVAAFARHARAEDATHEIPSVGVFASSRPERPLPHIYSPDEGCRILQAASHLGPRGTLRPYTYYTLFGLLMCTGLRISEALRLRLADVSADGLVVRETKFRKSRLVPLHETAAAALERYIRRRSKISSESDHLFVSLQGCPLWYQVVNKTFLEIVRGLRMHPGPGHRGPRLHDMRHTLAVRVLEAGPDGRDHVGQHVRALSTYLGHCGVAETYWYLQVTPQLMQDMADACEAAVKGGAR
jgi:integrase